MAVTVGLVVALIAVGGGLLLYSRSGSDTPTASSPSATTTSRSTSPASTTRSTTTTTAPSSTRGGSGAPDTLEGAFPMITGRVEACGEVPVDPVELQVGSETPPQRAVQCAFGGSPVDGALYLGFPTATDATLFQFRSLPDSTTRSWGKGEGTEGAEVDHTSPSGVVEQELYFAGSRYVAVVQAGPGTDVEQVFQWTAKQSRAADDMPG